MSTFQMKKVPCLDLRGLTLYKAVVWKTEPLPVVVKVPHYEKFLFLGNLFLAELLS